MEGSAGAKLVVSLIRIGKGAKTSFAPACSTCSRFREEGPPPQGSPLRGVTAAVGLTAGTARAQMSPEESLQSLKVPEGLEVKLFATEPDLVNPTNIDIDSKGRVWVLEAANYRKFKTRPEGDRIVVLEDTNGDGKADKTTVFYQDPSLFAPL